VSNAWTAWTLTSVDLLTAGLPSGLHLRDIAALTLVGSHQGCSVDWLRTRVGLTQSGTVRLIDRLETLRLLARSRDGRFARLSLSEEGEAVLARWHDAQRAAFATATSGLNTRERAGLSALLAKALQNSPRPRTDADRACRTCDWTACGADCPVDRSVVDSS
jgi:DNA-binding MarR family transcriptional regulator